jgi:hypothetical protein
LPPKIARAACMPHTPSVTKFSSNFLQVIRWWFPRWLRLKNRLGCGHHCESREGREGARVHLFVPGPVVASRQPCIQCLNSLKISHDYVSFVSKSCLILKSHIFHPKTQVLLYTCFVLFWSNLWPLLEDCFKLIGWF